MEHVIHLLKDQFLPVKAWVKLRVCVVSMKTGRGKNIVRFLKETAYKQAAL